MEEIECHDCGWSGEDSELSVQEDGDHVYCYCPECGSNDLEEIEDE